MNKTYLYFKNFNYTIYVVKSNKKYKFFVEKNINFHGGVKTTMHKAVFIDGKLKFIPDVKVSKNVKDEIIRLNNEIYSKEFKKRLIFLENYNLL